MNLGKVFGVGALSLSLLGLGACGSSQASKPVSKQTTEAGSGTSTSDKSKSSTDTNVTQDNGNSTSSDSGKSSQNSGSVQSSDSGQSTSTTTTPKPKPATPPKTQKEAIGDLASAIKTKVPLMLPTIVPVTQGKFLTGTTHSETWYYKVSLFETAHPAIINTRSAYSGALIATVEGTEYKDEASAKASINGYTKVDPTQGFSIDLGHGIKAVENAGMGHSYLMWNEGRWSLNIDSPNDTTYKNKKYPDSKKLAQDVVAFLDQNGLPAPQSMGVIMINNWNKSYGTTITWQNHQMTYQVTSSDPFAALKVAVAMHLMSK